MEAKSLKRKLILMICLKISDNAFCSKDNIKINDNTNLITGENSGFIVDDYDISSKQNILYLYYYICCYKNFYYWDNILFH